MVELYTIGYRAGWTPETLLMTMRESNAVLCDIRYMPHPRRYPEWNHGTLAKQFGERYRHIKALGNRNYKNPGAPIDIVDLDEGIRQIEALFRKFSHVIAMCGYHWFKRCHHAIVVGEANRRVSRNSVMRYTPLTRDSVLRRSPTRNMTSSASRNPELAAILRPPHPPIASLPFQVASRLWISYRLGPQDLVVNPRDSENGLIMMKTRVAKYRHSAKL